MSITSLPYKLRGKIMADVFKKDWGKSRLRFCPTNKVAWSQKRDGTVVRYKDMPTYGLEREEIPNEKNV